MSALSFCYSILVAIIATCLQAPDSPYIPLAAWLIALDAVCSDLLGVFSAWEKRHMGAVGIFRCGNFGVIILEA